MNENKKTFLILLLPAVLTVYFIFWVFIPSIQSYGKLKDEYKSLKRTHNEILSKTEELKNNKKLIGEINEINMKIADFDIQFPSEFEDEYFIADLGKFSKTSDTKIISLNAGTEKPVMIKNSEKSEKKRGKRKKKKQTPSCPINVYEKPFDFKITGYYNKTVNFVNILENYQRKFIINGISAQISKNDEKKPNPKIELAITGSVFTAAENPAFFNPPEKTDSE